MDVQPTPPLELEEMDAKIIEFTKSHSETFNFNSEGLGEREKLRKYCMKVLDYNLNSLDMDDEELSEPTLQKHQEYASNSLLCLKILLRDERLVKKLVNNTTFIKNVLDLMPLGENDHNLKFIKNYLACLYNIVFSKKDICEMFDEHMINLLMQFALRDPIMFRKTPKNQIPELIVKTAGGLLVFATHTNFCSVVWEYIEAFKEILMINEDWATKVLYASLKERPEWLTDDCEFHENMIDYYTKHLLKNPADKAMLSLALVCSVQNKKKPSIEVVLKVCENFESMPSNPREMNAETTTLVYTTLNFLLHYCQYFSEIRKAVCSKILPKRLINDIRSKRPEQENTAGALLINCFTSPDVRLSISSQHFVFVLCKENIDRFIKRTGFGNAAGLLANRSMLGSQLNKSKGDVNGKLFADYSDESDSENDNPEEDFMVDEKEREKFGDYNSVLGTHQKVTDQFENMSDDEKEREANRLASMINDMTVQGVIKPMSMDPLTGVKTELNMHPGLIADSLKYASGLKKDTESETETDSD